MRAADCEKHVPPGATCFVIDYSSQCADIAAFVPKEGLIILRNGKVTGWCDIVNEPVISIAIYLTYQPFKKHYVLQCASKVIIVSNPVPLKVTHEFQDVVKFEIRDFKNVGCPQLVLWKNSTDAPLVTDLTSSSFQPPTNPVETILRTKLRGLKLSVDKVRRQVEEKKRLRRHCIYQMLGADPVKSPLSYQILPSISSTPAKGGMEAKSRRQVIAVVKSWHRLLNRCWILGCDVKNISLLPLRSISLCASPTGPEAQPPPFVKWRVMVRRGAAEPGSPAWAPLPPDGVLEAGQRAVIVASVPEPAFLGRSPVAEMHAVLMAALPDGEETRAAVPAWRLSAEAVLRGDLVPFGAPAAPEEDLLASLACCPVRARLRLEGRDGDDLGGRVARLLADAGLRPPDADVAPRAPQGVASLLVGSGSPETPLHGAVAVLRVLASTACTLRLHVRDGRHVFLLLHSLRAGLPQHTRLLDADAEAVRVDADLPTLGRDLLRALEAELGALSRPRGGPPSRPELHPLEMATDLAAQRLRVASAARGAAAV